MFLSCVLFSLMHINSTMGSLPILIVAILILPQFIGGLYFSFARMKYGLIGSIVLHSITNLIIMLALFGKTKLIL